jgi:hypothetical protein
MKPLSIRDLQKISAAAIERLPGPVAVKSGDDTIAILTPLKKANPKAAVSFVRLVETTRARALRAGLDESAEDKKLSKYGVVEKLDLPGTRETLKRKQRSPANKKKRA